MSYQEKSDPAVATPLAESAKTFTQIESLKQSLAYVIAKYGEDASSAQDLRAQISSHERQARQRAGTELPRENPVSFR